MKQETVVERGMGLNLVDKNNQVYTVEFWGEGASDAAVAKYKEFNATAQVTWHQFQPITREVK